MTVGAESHKKSRKGESAVKENAVDWTGLEEHEDLRSKFEKLLSPFFNEAWSSRWR